MGVSMIPGAMEHTRIREPARSRAATSVMPTTPPLDAEYAIWPIWPSNPAIEAVSTQTPRSPSISSFFAMPAAARRRTLNVPMRLTVTTCV